VAVVRVREDVYEELKRMKVKVGAKSMSELISLLLRIASDRIDSFKGDPSVFLETLRYAGDAGEHDSERLDELVYGVED